MDSEPTPDFYSGKGLNRAFYLPRLGREFYQGNAVVHWTMPIAMRKVGWLNEEFHAQFREVMLHASAREDLFCPTYCLMPDHIHLLWMGLQLDSDQRNGMKFLREHVGRALQPHRFQHQSYDHVLRVEERERDAFAKVCSYILANPIRAGLIREAERWPYCGAIVPGYPAINPLEEKFWPLFWKLYLASRSPEAGQRKLPPRYQT